MTRRKKSRRTIAAAIMGCLFVSGCAGTTTRMTRQGLDSNTLVKFERWGLESATVEEVTALIVGEWCLIGKGIPIKGVEVHQVELYEFSGTADCERERHRFCADGSYVRQAGRLGDRENLADTWEFVPESSTLAAPGFDDAFLVDITRGYMIVMLNPELGRMGIVHVFGNVG